MHRALHEIGKQATDLAWEQTSDCRSRGRGQGTGQSQITTVKGISLFPPKRTPSENTCHPKRKNVTLVLGNGIQNAC